VQEKPTHLAAARGHRNCSPVVPVMISERSDRVVSAAASTTPPPVAADAAGRYWHTLRRRALPVLQLAAAAAAAAATLCLVLPPRYEATARLVIDKSEQKVVSFQEVPSLQATDSDYYRTQYQVLRSRSLARRVVAALDLAAHPDYAAAAAAARGELSWPARVLRALLAPGAALRGMTRPAGGEDAILEAVADELLDDVAVEPVGDSWLVDITATSRDPELAARIANAVVELYIRQDHETRAAAARHVVEQLTPRLAESRQELADAEGALQAYKRETELVSLDDGRNIVVDGMKQLNAALTEARVRRTSLEAAHAAAQAALAGRLPAEAVPEVAGSGLLQSLKIEQLARQREFEEVAKKFGPKHPKYLEARATLDLAASRLGTETRKILASVRTHFEVAHAHEQALEQAVRAQADAALDLDQKAIAYATLRQHAEATRAVHDELLRRVSEARLTSQLETGNVRVVDAAEAPAPDAPASPRPLLYVPLAALAALLLGGGLVVALELLAEVSAGLATGAPTRAAQAAPGGVAAVPAARGSTL
jgi:succinoglycan biosynthesis transport protein ExoP